MLQTPQSDISPDKIFTLLWCIWRARNDYLFNRNIWSVLQVHHVAAALLLYGIEDQAMHQEESHRAAHMTIHEAITTPPVALLPAGPKACLQVQTILRQQMAPSPGTTVKDTSNIPGPIVFTDAAWSPGSYVQPVSAGLGLFIQLGDDRPCSHVYISAVSPPVSQQFKLKLLACCLQRR
jgi:hypothetical protein